jgi:tetratricopeptide (TPR) repeat protein
MKKGNLDDAIAEHRKALRLQPDYAMAHYNLGNVLRKKGDANGAIAEYRTAIRLQPDNAAAHYILGLALGSKGDFHEALEELRAAYLLDPKNPTYAQEYETVLKEVNRQRIYEEPTARRACRGCALGVVQFLLDSSFDWHGPGSGSEDQGSHLGTGGTHQCLKTLWKSQIVRERWAVPARFAKSIMESRFQQSPGNNARLRNANDQIARAADSRGNHSTRKSNRCIAVRQ